MSSDVPAVSAKPGSGETARATHNNNDGDQQTVLIPVDASKEAEIAFECKLSPYLWLSHIMLGTECYWCVCIWGSLYMPLDLLQARNNIHAECR